MDLANVTVMISKVFVKEASGTATSQVVQKGVLGLETPCAGHEHIPGAEITLFPAHVKHPVPSQVLHDIGQL